MLYLPTVLKCLGMMTATTLSEPQPWGVFCAPDAADLLRLASEGVKHAGIIFAQQQKATIGGWVREIRALHARLRAEDVVGQVIFLSAQ
jgi:hypothetical protein